jgi:hypothetical protein
MFTCPKCKAEFETGITYRSGKHTRLDCPECKSYIKFLPQEPIGEPADFTLSFGRHIGKTIAEIHNIDPIYIHWLGTVKGLPGKMALSFLHSFPNTEISALPEKEDEQLPLF